MAAKCGQVNCCGLWLHRLNPGCGLFEQYSGVGSRETRLPPINGWQVRDERLTAYIRDFLLSYPKCQVEETRRKFSLGLGGPRGQEKSGSAAYSSVGECFLLLSLRGASENPRRICGLIFVNPGR